MKTIEDLLPDLISKTIAGNITWAKRPPNKAGYQTPMAKYILAVFEWSDPESETEGITISIHDAAGEQLDYMSIDQYSSRHAKFLELYQTARRSALGLDKIIDEISEALDNVLPF